MEKTKLIRNAPHQKYYLADGTTQVPGGSTICKIGDDPSGLIYWAWDLGRQGKDYRKERDNAADIGTIAHFLIECFLNNQVADLEDFDQADIDKALICYNKFADWWSEQQLEVVATEIQLVHNGLRYGGTIDLVAKAPCGAHVLIDFKTSKKISDSYWRQVAGYAGLWDENHEHKADLRIKNHAIVRIGKQEEGDFEVEWKPDLLRQWNTFQKQVELYWTVKNEKPAKVKKAKK
jgi:hypothetical protein